MQSADHPTPSATLTDSSNDPLRQITPAVDGNGNPKKEFQTTGQWEVYSPNEGDEGESLLWHRLGHGLVTRYCSPHLSSLPLCLLAA